MIKPFPLDFHYPVTGFFKMLFTYGIRYIFVNLVIDGYILDINVQILIIVVCTAGNHSLNVLSSQSNLYINLGLSNMASHVIIVLCHM